VTRALPDRSVTRMAGEHIDAKLSAGLNLTAQPDDMSALRTVERVAAAYVAGELVPAERERALAGKLADAHREVARLDYITEAARGLAERWRGLETERRVTDDPGADLVVSRVMADTLGGAARDMEGVLEAAGPVGYRLDPGLMAQVHLAALMECLGAITGRVADVVDADPLEVDPGRYADLCHLFEAAWHHQVPATVEDAPPTTSTEARRLANLATAVMRR
jgi:hypothetical protein